MRPGPPKTPTALAEVRGRPGRRPPPPDEPKPALADATPPADLSDEALEIWQAVAPQFVAVGLLAVVDRMHVARACRWEAIGRAQLTEAEENPTADTKANGVQPSGELKAALLAFKAADEVWFRFGITPAERTHLRGSGPSEPKDRLAERLGSRPKAPRLATA